MDETAAEIAEQKELLEWGKAMENMGMANFTEQQWRVENARLAALQSQMATMSGLDAALSRALGNIQLRQVMAQLRVLPQQIKNLQGQIDPLVYNVQAVEKGFQGLGALPQPPHSTPAKPPSQPSNNISITPGNPWSAYPPAQPNLSTWAQWNVDVNFYFANQFLIPGLKFPPGLR